MKTEVEIRESETADLVSIEKLYPDAFPDEDLLPLVRELLRQPSGVLSLVGTLNTQVVGHVIFTRCNLATEAERIALLGPLAVAPDWQNQGVGSSIVQAGLNRLDTAGVTHAYVLGDPNYYGRFGFQPEAGVMPPYPLPPEWHGAWQSICLQRGKSPLKGRLSVPGPWLEKTLWAP